MGEFVGLAHSPGVRLSIFEVLSGSHILIYSGCTLIGQWGGSIFMIGRLSLFSVCEAFRAPTTINITDGVVYGDEEQPWGLT